MDQEIKTFIGAFYEALNTHDVETILNCWHPKGTLRVNGEVKDISFLTGLPSFVGFDLKVVEVSLDHDDYHACKCHWHMTMPGSEGIHDSVLNIKPEGRSFKIHAMIDHGRQA